MSVSEASYGRGAAVLSAGIGITGLVTYTYFSIASHVLPEDEYGHISLLWSAVFIVVSVLYRPVEQLLARTIAERDERGIEGTEHLRAAARIQLGLGALFAALALIARDPLENDLFDGSSTLYWVLIVAVLAYAGSYFARGYLAGHHRFGLYGGLVLVEATSRCMFALAVAVGISEGESAVALGMAVAPLVSLAIVPLAIRGRTPFLSRKRTGSSVPVGERNGVRPLSEFAAAVLLIMLCEQTFLNAGPLLVQATEGAAGAALAGFTFNALLIARAPLQLFQSVQTSILPHLTRMRAGGADDAFRRSINLTLAAVAVFSLGVAGTMLAAGPALMDLFFGGDFDYGRGGLAVIALGMGLYLAAATLNQAALARERAKQAAACWLAAATGFVAFLLAVEWDDRVEQVEIAFASAAFALFALLYALYRRDALK